MVVYTNNRASPKRKTADHSERTAQQVADTNAALQMFTSRRRSSWMQNPSSSMSPREGAMGNTAERASRGNSATPQDDVQNNNNNMNGTANGTNQQTERTTRPANVQWRTFPALDTNSNAERPSDSGHLVDYVSPCDLQMPTPFTTAAAPLSRTPSEGVSRPVLPSPALSDDNTNPHVNAIVIPDEQYAPFPPNEPTERPRGRPRKYPRLSVVSNGSMPSPGRQPSGNTARNSPSEQSPMQATVPNSAMQPPRNGHLNTPTSNLTPTAPRPQNFTNPAAQVPLPQQSAPPGVAQTPQVVQSASGLYDGPRMKQSLDDAFCGSNQSMNNLDKGRKQLLLEAVQKEDFFYLVLHQMFCLHSCQHVVLPPQLSHIPPASWSVLESLLCSNQAVTPQILRWFSEFPASLQMICTSDDAPEFAKQVKRIEIFLQGLPQRWNGLINTCQFRAAPPLTQELVENLHLTSPVLQTTTFRAIARLFWGEYDTYGSRILESLHRIDQQTYTDQHWRRTDAEKGMALGVLAHLFKTWTVWCGTAGNSPDAFEAPAECNYFHTPTSNVMRPAVVNIDPRMSAMQQQRLMETNDRVQAQQHTALPGLTHPLQRKLNSQAGIQGQGASPRPPSFSQQQNAHQNRPPSNGSMAPQQYLARPAGLPAVPGVAQPNRLLPPAGAQARPLPVHPDTVRVSLHQAHLRSPVPASKKLAPGEQPLYRHVVGYALPPTALDKSCHAQCITISISKASMERIPATTPDTTPGGPGFRLLNESSHLYRLRCSRMPPGAGFQTENSWVTADNIWPDVLTFQMNAHFLEARRKLHHGRYLPINLTPYLQVGENTLSAFTLPTRTDASTYALAIEIIGVTSHASILTNTPTISAETSLAAITRSLANSSSTEDPDDDIGITSSSLTIPLFDPFRADRICDIPVRGSACLHRDCFDLETFLSQCAREHPGYPSVPDCWRCPICKGDVRPQTLLKDGFLMLVREELAAKGLLDTRAIVVQPDGSWKPKPEELATGVRSASLEREEADAAAAAGGAESAVANRFSGVGKGKQRAIEVIELD
ncbi:hypothetical protein Q7P37_004657 [Cladosporium fusiforme]